MDGSVEKPTTKFVDHTYRDFSRFLITGGELPKPRRVGKPNFPAKIHSMLSDDCNNDAITWMPHGRAFKIIKRDDLISRVIPKYFVCAKYVSFTRQLNAWGFKRLYQRGRDYGCFYHECFLRGMPELTSMITLVPPRQGKRTPFPDGEPNFDYISGRYPLPLETKQNSKGSASVKSTALGPKKEENINGMSAVERTEEATGKQEVPSLPVLHPEKLDEHSKPCIKGSVSERQGSQSNKQQLDRSRSSPQVAYPPFHCASSQHGMYQYYGHSAPSAQSHGYNHGHHYYPGYYPWYYYPPAPPPPPPPPTTRDECSLNSVSASKLPTSSLSPSIRDRQRAMKERNASSGPGRDTGDPYAPIPLEAQRHDDSSDQGASLPDDSLEQASQLFLCKTKSEMHDEETTGRDSELSELVGQTDIQVSMSDEGTVEHVSQLFPCRTNSVMGDEESIGRDSELSELARQTDIQVSMSDEDTVEHVSRLFL